MPPHSPPTNCSLCPRLFDFRCRNLSLEPEWHNAPVASFGDPKASLLIIGLAPGLRGANRTGRPFTGDFAGDLLYKTLKKFGYSRGSYAGHSADKLQLIDCRITNAVRCVPPKNKPTGHEISACRRYLLSELSSEPAPNNFLALGRIAHETLLVSFGLKKSGYKFAHNAIHDLGFKKKLFDSYHCSRYNTNTGRLTTEMFETVFASIRSNSK